MSANRHEHWQDVWRQHPPGQLSWHQEHADRSLALITASLNDLDAPMIDVGGGDSPLPGELLGRGYTDLTVLDIAEAALAQGRCRLGSRVGDVTWVAGDVTRFAPQRSYQLWHDRAVFHFLTEPTERDRYTAAAAASIAPGGWLVIATFALDGPDHCSGLPVQRYSTSSLAEALADGFRLFDSTSEQHPTPGGPVQSFLYGRFKRV